MRDAVEADLARRQQARQTAAQLAIQPIGVRHAEVRQRVVVDADTATEPAIGVVLLAQAGQRAGTANPVQCRIQPQRHQDRRVGLRMARCAFAGVDLIEQRPQVKALHHLPDQPHKVVLADQFVQ